MGFRGALLEEGVQCLLGGDVAVGKSVLRDYINATVGLKELGGMTGKYVKSLMRMLGPQGDTQARSLFEIIGCLQERGSAIERARCPVRSSMVAWGRPPRFAATRTALPSVGRRSR